MDGNQRTIYEQGWCDRKAGVPLTDCPVGKEDGEHYLWKAGWYAAAAILNSTPPGKHPPDPAYKTGSTADNGPGPAA